MSRITVFCSRNVVLCALVFLFLSPYIVLSDAKAEKSVPVRIGWQTSWATQGQIAMVLKNTNILELNGLKGEFKGFTYGGPLNEGALAGEVDVIFTADQPACMLIAKGAKWKIVGRLIYNRVGTIVPKNSEIKTILDLKGKRIGIPFGAAAQRETLRALKESGLDPSKDVKCLNIGINEQINVIQKGGDKGWPDIDAFSTWDPHLADLEINGKARVLDYSLVTAVIVMSEDFIIRHPAAAVDFLKSYITAFYYYANNQKRANEWFKKESRLEIDNSALDLAASVEPNLKVKDLNLINVGLSEKDTVAIQSGADFIFEQGFTDKHIKDVSMYIDLSYYNTAIDSLKLNTGDYIAKISTLSD